MPYIPVHFSHPQIISHYLNSHPHMDRNIPYSGAIFHSPILPSSPSHVPYAMSGNLTQFLELLNSSLNVFWCPCGYRILSTLQKGGIFSPFISHQSRAWGKCSSWFLLVLPNLIPLKNNPSSFEVHAIWQPPIIATPTPPLFSLVLSCVDTKVTPPHSGEI